jgi:hypothetical protein
MNNWQPGIVEIVNMVKVIKQIHQYNPPVTTNPSLHSDLHPHCIYFKGKDPPLLTVKFNNNVIILVNDNPKIALRLN